jgi:hypothetical protein
MISAAVLTIAASGASVELRTGTASISGTFTRAAER